MIEHQPETHLLAAWFSPLADTRTWRRFAYLLSTFPAGQFWFVVSVTLLATGFGMLVIGVGAAILAFLVVLWRSGARIERALARALGDVPIAEPQDTALPARSGLFSWTRSVLADRSTWQSAAWLFLLFPLGIVWLTFLAVVWGIPGSLALSIPIVLADGASLTIGSWLAVSSLPGAIIATPFGVALLPLAARATVAAGDVHTGLARALLAPNRTEALEAEVQDITDRRDKSVATAEHERRRIERDLHDGAQQRLVAVAMELGRAKQKFDESPEEARELVEAAHAHAKEALEELRDLARGIHPAVLTDRGLDPALSALAARSPIPVQIRYGLDRRPPVSVESAAYFVISEALANVGKHALASIVEVTIDETETGRVLIEVTDDGVGGAVPTGSGLSGLADRVEALGGRLQIISPIGGPTQVIAELPCGW
ncbi:MAG: sensor domain-containing protein [Acidimicrobiia bacterium]|nr:sensor domain-containing protein [Acidimicrobiia bacterium]